MSNTSATRRKTIRVFASVALALVVASCSAYNNIFGNGDVPFSCPDISMMPDTDTLTMFREGGGKDIIDVDFEGKITSIKGSCTGDVNEDTNEGTLTVQVSVGVDLSRGPANKDHRVSFDYFVAVADSSKNILNKKIFGVDAEFPGNFTNISWTDYPDNPVVLNIPLKAGQDGGGFNIFVGFQLTREALKYNRRRLEEKAK